MEGLGLLRGAHGRLQAGGLTGGPTASDVTQVPIHLWAVPTQARAGLTPTGCGGDFTMKNESSSWWLPDIKSLIGCVTRLQPGRCQSES